MNRTFEYLEELSKETKQDETEMLSKAIQVGVRQLWREHILGQYLRGQISRVDAVEAVGIDLIELAERQHDAMMEDLEWAMKE